MEVGKYFILIQRKGFSELLTYKVLIVSFVQPQTWITSKRYIQNKLDQTAESHSYFWMAQNITT